MALAHINLNCPHCGVLTHVCKDCVISCNACRNVWSVRVEKESPGFQELRVEWFDGLDVRGKPVYHHITTPAPEPAPKPQPQPREYKCLNCGWHECSETDWFKCTQCGNWTHDDIRARFEALKDIPPPAPGAETLADKRAGIRRKIYTCPNCGTLSQQEVLKPWTCRHCGTYVPPHPNDKGHAERVAKSGYDRKAARTKALQRSELRWIGAAFVAVIVLARFVTAHDFGFFVGDVLTLALGAAIGLTFFKPDKR